MKDILALIVLLILMSATILCGQEKFEVGGAMIIGNSEDPAPVLGTVRYNSITNDFEGWNGQWVSLTNSGSNQIFGEAPPSLHVESEKVTASDPGPDDGFGFSVSVSGDYAIIGAVGDNTSAAAGAGSAYIFNRSGTQWVEQAKITASDGAANDEFGYCVSISGDYAIVGARRNDDAGNDSGSAYIFARSGTIWTEQAKLTASDAASNDQFGFSVSISGDYAMVGARLNDDNGANSGSVYYYSRSGTSWTEQGKLFPSDNNSGDEFGYSVSISGDYAVVGSRFDDISSANNVGSAYIFTRMGINWFEEEKLTANDGSADDQFGYSVSISGDYAIVGARLDDDNGTNSGSVYVYERSGSNWNQQTKLTPFDGSADDQFGYHVSISDNYVVIGAPYQDRGQTETGTAYVYQHSSGSVWHELTQLLARDSGADDEFGISVAIYGDDVVVGGWKDDDTVSNAGSAYFY